MRSIVALVLLPAVGLAYNQLSDASLNILPDSRGDFDIHHGALLSPILRPRVPGTPGHDAVLDHLATFFRTQLPAWKLEFQNSTATTPVSHGEEVPFVNLIATRDPPGSPPGEVGRLALVAHYDSKLTPTGFIGAIDSAAPCAMILHAVRSLDQALTNKWAATADSLDDLDERKGLQVLLLDGEEAFVEWSQTDSTYGARSLASEWEFSYNTALSNYRTPLDAISLFLLLDLLGTEGSTVPSYFQTTHWAYEKLADIEARMRRLGLFQSSPNHASKVRADEDQARAAEPMFLKDAHKKESVLFHSQIEDDHIPFMQRGVEILHMIPSPFPLGIWHELADDGDHLDMDTVEDWAKLVMAFAAEWMELEGFLSRNAVGPAERAGAKEAARRKTEFRAR